jgi:hypothetical protein
LKLTSTSAVPKTVGTLTVYYRDGRAPAQVTVR